MDGKRPGAPVALPGPGADTRAVLQSLGYDEARIIHLSETGAIAVA